MTHNFLSVHHFFHCSLSTSFISLSCRPPVINSPWSTTLSHLISSPISPSSRLSVYYSHSNLFALLFFFHFFFLHLFLQSHFFLPTALSQFWFMFCIYRLLPAPSVAIPSNLFLSSLLSFKSIHIHFLSSSFPLMDYKFVILFFSFVHLSHARALTNLNRKNAFRCNTHSVMTAISAQQSGLGI